MAWSELQAEAAGDDFLLDLGGAAEVLSERPATATLAARMANLDSAALVVAQHVRSPGWIIFALSGFAGSVGSSACSGRARQVDGAGDVEASGGAQAALRRRNKGLEARRAVARAPALGPGLGQLDRGPDVDRVPAPMPAWRRPCVRLAVHYRPWPGMRGGRQPGIAALEIPGTALPVVDLQEPYLPQIALELAPAHHRVDTRIGL